MERTGRYDFKADHTSPSPRAAGEKEGTHAAAGAWGGWGGSHMRGADKKTTERARLFRREATAAESKLWQHLKSRQLDGHKFNRQEPIGPYFADFACRKSRLVVEIDGETHETPDERAYDERRTSIMATLGYRVIRFTNDDIFGDLGPVFEEIRKYLN